MHRFAQEKAAEEGRLHHQELEAMEHYYHDQFSMLVETLAREKEEVAVRDKAQKRVSVFEVNFGLYYYIIVIPFYGLSLSLLPPSLSLLCIRTCTHTCMNGHAFSLLLFLSWPSGCIESCIRGWRRRSSSCRMGWTEMKTLHTSESWMLSR